MSCYIFNNLINLMLQFAKNMLFHEQSDVFPSFLISLSITKEYIICQAPLTMKRGSEVWRQSFVLV